VQDVQDVHDVQDARTCGRADALGIGR